MTQMIFKDAVSRIELRIVVQIQNIGVGFFYTRPLWWQNDAHVGRQIDDKQERAYLIIEL